VTQVEHARIRRKQIRQARALYGGGASVRAVATEMGCSYGKAYALLEDGGVVLRPHGGRRTPVVR